MTNSIVQEKFYPIEEKAPLLQQKDEETETQILLGAIFKNTYSRESLDNQNLQPGQTSNYSGERFLKLLPVIPALLQLQDPFSPCPNQTPRDQENHLPNRLHHGLDFLPVQNLFLKKIHQIVPQHQQLKIGVIPPIRMRDDLIQTQSINPLFDKILTTGPLIVKMPDLFGNQRTIGDNDLIIIRGPFPAQKSQLLSGGFVPFHRFTNDHHPQGDSRGQDVRDLPHLNPPAYFLPIPQHLNLLLHPRLQGYHHIELDLPLDQKLQKLLAEKTAVGPKANLLQMTGKFPQDLLQKGNGLVRTVMIPATKQSSQTIPGLPKETKHGLITLSPLFLRIVTHRRPLLPTKDRRHMQIQIQSQFPQSLKPFAELHQQIEIQETDLLSHGHSQARQETTDRRLDREIKESSDFVENAIANQNPHLPRPGMTQKQAVQQTDQHVPYAKFTLPTARNLNLPLYLLLQVVAFEKPSDQSGTPKAGHILAREFFLNGLNFFRVVNLTFLGYILFHLLSASSIVIGVWETPLFYYSGRHFCFRKCYARS